MAVNLADAERIVQAIRKAGARCFHPTLRALGSDLFEKLAQLTAPDGILGPVKGGFYSVTGLPFSWSSWFAERDKCLPYAEYGSHVFDTLMALTGEEAESVWCHSGRYFREFDQDDVSTIVIRFPSGGYFRMTIDWVMKKEWDYSDSRFHLICENGLIEHEWFGAKWRSGKEKGRFASRRKAEAQGWRWEHYDSLVKAIEGGESCSPNEEDGLRYMRIIGAALESNKTGAWAEVAPVQRRDLP
jgi:predicted dehydrogenase